MRLGESPGGGSGSRVRSRAAINSRGNNGTTETKPVADSQEPESFAKMCTGTTNTITQEPSTKPRPVSMAFRPHASARFPDQTPQLTGPTKGQKPKSTAGHGTVRSRISQAESTNPRRKAGLTYEVSRLGPRFCISGTGHRDPEYGRTARAGAQPAAQENLPAEEGCAQVPSPAMLTQPKSGKILRSIDGAGVDQRETLTRRDEPTHKATRANLSTIRREETSHRSAVRARAPFRS